MDFEKFMNISAVTHIYQSIHAENALLDHKRDCMNKVGEIFYSGIAF